jgi:hypothetical protein
VTYILRAGTTNYYKIGFTRGSIARRQVELQPGCPWRLTLISVLEGIHHERRLHTLWAEHRLIGEWFELLEFEVSGAVSVPVGEGER